MMLAMFMASLKVALTTELEQTPTEPFAGPTESTVGGGLHPLAAVVKLQTKLPARALPNRSRTPVVMVAVYTVLMARGLDGVNVKMVLLASGVMVPLTPGATVKVDELMLETFMASLKVAVTELLEQTPVEAVGGVTETTIGGG